MHVSDIINNYLEEVKRKYYSGIASEHAYRPALQTLMESLCPGINAINDAKRVEVGAPDFVLAEAKQHPLQKELIRSIPLGFLEAKDVKPGIMDKPENQKQLERYMDLGNVVHTDSLTFRFYFEHELVKEVCLGEINIDGQIITDENGFDDLAHYFRQTVSRSGRTIRTAKTLALHMADRARPIRTTILQALAQDLDNDEDTELSNQFYAFQKTLIHDLSIRDFSDIYAETIAYGLFAARYNDDTEDDFTLGEAAQRIPQTNPFLRQFFLQIAAYEKDPRLNWVLNNFADLFTHTDVKKIMSTYGKDTGMNHDPVTHFYETFLGEYDPKRRKARGVYYTPLPIVKHIVQAINNSLISDFGLADGLADDSELSHEFTTQPYRLKYDKKDRTIISRSIPKLQLFDPATGTSTFLNEIIKYVYDIKGKQIGAGWSDYVEKSLLKRIHGFEILMAAYSMAHMRLGLTLQDTNYIPTAHAPRLGVYLTNSLEPPSEDDHSLLGLLGMGRTLTEEANEADKVKRDLPIMVVLGNPPYSGVSSNETVFANSLIEKYKVEPGGMQKLQERKHWLNDDYVKFIALAENMISVNGSGIVAMITNNGYLDNKTFRGMRWHLAKTFDKIHIIDLHGNAKKMETAPDGSKDENVFDIMQGVSILIAIKNKSNQDKLADVYHSEIYGKRQFKYAQLENEPKFTKLSPSAPMYFFVPKNTDGKSDYDDGVGLDRLFIKDVAGIVTARDGIAVNTNKAKLAEKINRIADPALSDDEVRSWLFPNKVAGKYDSGDSRGWKLPEARKKIEAEDIESNIQLVEYRPFDTRYIYYSPSIVDWGRFDLMPNLLKENYALCFSRNIEQKRDWADIFIVDKMMTHHSLSIKEVNYCAPLYLYHDDGTKTANFKTSELNRLTANLSIEVAPEDIFDYIYAILQSPSYRLKYHELLKDDFPKVPIPKNDEEFKNFVKLGHELRDLHLMKTVPANSITFEGEGNNFIDKLSFDGTNVYINSTQYFKNVSETSWNYYIGSYQPAQKWLKDRKGSELGYKEIEHYQKILNILSETERITRAIDI